MAITTSSIASDPFAVALLEKNAEIEKLRAALIATRKLVSEAAMTGFNCQDGDWAERLFANQANITAALEQKAGEK